MRNDGLRHGYLAFFKTIGASTEVSPMQQVHQHVVPGYNSLTTYTVDLINLQPKTLFLTLSSTSVTTTPQHPSQLHKLIATTVSIPNLNPSIHHLRLPHHHHHHHPWSTFILTHQAHTTILVACTGHHLSFAIEILVVGRRKGRQRISLIVSVVDILIKYILIITCDGWVL